MARIVAMIFLTLAAGLALAEPPPAVDATRPALPPPAFEDKGVVTTPRPSVAPTIEPDAPDTRPVREKAAREQDMESIVARSELTKRQEGTDTVEEYREKGQLRMIRILSENGPDRVYIDRDSDGRLEREAGDGPVSPVYFTIYEWN